MKKIIATVFVTASFSMAVSAQDFCTTAKSVVDASTVNFEAMKGKYTSSEYDGLWKATVAIPGAQSCIIEENTGWYVATFVTGVPKAVALARFNELAEKLKGCMTGYTSWYYQNVGEHMQTWFFAESKDGSDNDNSVAKGKSCELELRQKNGSGEQWEVRIKIYKS